MASKKVKDNVDRGLWVEYGSGYIAGASELHDIEGSFFLLTFHKGEMPAFRSEAFDTLDELEAAMRSVEPDLRKWRTSSN